MIISALSALPFSAYAEEVQKISATVTGFFAGAATDSTAVTTADSTYTVSIIAWHDCDSVFNKNGENIMQSTDTFDGEKTYTVGVRFVPTEGNSIANSVDATINGQVGKLGGYGSGGREFYVTVKVHSATEVEAAEATCTKSGNNAYYYCAGCQKAFKDKEGTTETTADAEKVKAKGHKMAFDALIAPTCTEKGKTLGTHCSVCGEVFIAQKEIAALGHSWDDGVVTKNSTPTATGVKTYTCKTCKATKTEAIPKCAKYANTLTAKGKTVTLKVKNVKKKAQTIAQKKAFSVSKAKGKVTYKKSKGNKKITVSKAGKVTVKKGLKKGTYKVKVKVTAAGNKTYKSSTKTVTVTVKVK